MKPINKTAPLSQNEHDANKANSKLDAIKSGMNQLPTMGQYTAQHFAFLDNEIEIVKVEIEMKACKAKLKALTKRFDELKKI